MQKYSFPLAITAIRIIALPVIVYAFNQEIRVVTCTLFIFAISTDFLDGYLAKKFEATSRIGFYFDVTADFLFIASMFSVFILEGFYQLWILFLVVFVFSQFMLSSIYSKRVIYDPVGKYYGSLMYGGIGFTLFFPKQLMFNIITIGVAVSTLVVLLSRLTYLLVTRTRTHK